MHCIVYQWRPRQIADVRILQSQLHSVNGRSASGDRIILQLSSMSEVLGIKTVLVSAKCSRTTPPSNTYLQALKIPGTSVGTIWNSIRARCRILLQSDEFIKFGTTNCPTDIVRSFLNIPQDIFVLVVPLAFHTCLENGFPILTKSSS